MDIKNNYYFKSFEGINLVYNEYWDFNLIPDRIGDYLPYAKSCKNSSDYNIISDGLVTWFDINNDNTTISGDYLTSLVEWSGTSITPYTGFTLDNWGLTGIDNGRTDCLSGRTLIITSADTKLVLYPVTGYTISYATTGCTVDGGLYIYPWTFHENNTTIDGCPVGDTICLDGGFYQGFFKLDNNTPSPVEVPNIDYCNNTGYTLTSVSASTNYQIMPVDFPTGWSMETWVNWSNDFCITGHTGTTLNQVYPNNSNFFFYIGTRSENKFWNNFSGETGLTTTTGIPLQRDDSLLYKEHIQGSNDGQSWTQVNSQNTSSCCVKCNVCGAEEYVDPSIITGGQNWLSNNSSSSSCCTSCNTSGSTTVVTGKTYSYCDQLSENALGFRITDDGKIGYRKMTVTGDCYNNQYKITGTVMEEGYSEPNTIPTGTSWNHIVVTYTAGSGYKNNLPSGTLKFWVNGLVKYKVDDFIGLKLRALDEWSDKQIGVPFNMSWGGGTQGLTESQTFGGPDYTDRDLLLQTNFAGTFEGELSQLRFYEKPLNVLEIRNNFFVDCKRYCRPDTFGGAQIVQPNYPGCGNCKNIIPPNPRIYYGKFIGNVLNNGDENNLTQLVTNSVTNTYVTLPPIIGYGYILIPSSFVQPSGFRDSSSGCSGFIIPMVNQSDIVINGITYKVYRTFNSTGASLDVWMCS